MKTYKVIVYRDGAIAWYNEKDELHREEGAAVEYANGDKCWYINGEELTEEEFNNRFKGELTEKFHTLKIKK